MHPRKVGEGPDLSLLAGLAGLCKQEVQATSEIKLPTGTLKAWPHTQHLTKAGGLRRLGKSVHSFVIKTSVAAHNKECSLQKSLTAAAGSPEEGPWESGFPSCHGM